MRALDGRPDDNRLLLIGCPRAGSTDSRAALAAWMSLSEVAWLVDASRSSVIGGRKL